jgi:hypothetical protein
MNVEPLNTGSRTFLAWHAIIAREEAEAFT